MQGEWQLDKGVSKHPSCNLNAIIHSPTPFLRAGVNNRGVSSSSPAGELVFLSESLTPVSAAVTCSSYYWTLFHWQSRKEERRGTLIAHLNGGCHIINAYRPALQAVTETPSHTSREEEGEWDINSCERRDGYQWPEIKWLALKEMRPEMRHLFGLEFSVRVLHNICLFGFWSAPSLSFCYLPPLFFPCFLSVATLWSEKSVAALSRHLVKTSSNRTSLKKFSVFMPVCVFICCRQQTVIPLSHPCVCVFALVLFFFLGWKMPDCMFVCVCACVCVRDVQWNALWYRESFRNAISSLSVYACIHVGFIRIWKCCAAVPWLASPSVCSRSLAFARSLASAVSPADSCIRDEGLERRGRPTPGETNRLHQETRHYKQSQHASHIRRFQVWGCMCVRSCVGGDVVVRNRWVRVFKFLYFFHNIVF